MTFSQTSIKGIHRPQLMGVLNVTPDSFSDGGKYNDPQTAVQYALKMVADGAAIIDIGAESTRPGSKRVNPGEQLRRLLPVLKAFRRKNSSKVSIDTQSAAVAMACLEEGADIINDISGLRHDPNMGKTLARYECQVVLMHMQGNPRTMQKNPSYKDVVAAILRFFRERMDACARAGIAIDRIMLDPGIGFGKSIEHNLAILRRLDEFLTLKRPLVVGVSRKSFLGHLSGESVPDRRVAASVVAGVVALIRGADILRVHDVAEHAAALRIVYAILK